MLDDRLEHLAGDHHTVDEQERRSQSSLGEVEEFHDWNIMRVFNNAGL